MADHRCGKMKDEAYSLIEEKLHTLFRQSSDQEIANFRDRVVGILSEAITHYTSVAGQYDPEVRDKHQLELKNQMKE